MIVSLTLLALTVGFGLLLKHWRHEETLARGACVDSGYDGVKWRGRDQGWVCERRS